MADWQTVRYDPTYEEPLDPELIPLLDALNDAGIVTTNSYSGHGSRTPYVCFAHSTDERIERLARFVMLSEKGDYREHFTMWQKEILLKPNALTHGHAYWWSLELRLNNVSCDTPPAEMMAEAVKAANLTAVRVVEFAARERLESRIAALEPQFANRLSSSAVYFLAHARNELAFGRLDVAARDLDAAERMLAELSDE